MNLRERTNNNVLRDHFYFREMRSLFRCDDDEQVAAWIAFRDDDLIRLVGLRCTIMRENLGPL